MDAKHQPLRLEMKDVSFAYGPSLPVLSGLKLQARAGEVLCILGRSGCGKTTLLNLAAGLLRPTGGSILVDGKAVLGPGTDRAVVFQQDSLFPWMTAKKNIRFAIRQALPGTSAKEAEAMALTWLQRVDLPQAQNQYPCRLSGGIRQRVAVARALAMHADTLLLDEPFGALDARTRYGLQALLLRLLESEPHRTVLLVTHDVDEAILLADCILYMQEGRIAHEAVIPFTRTGRSAMLRGNDAYKRMRGELLALFGFEENARSPEEEVILEGIG